MYKDCKKLIFLISFVLLLALVSETAFADPNLVGWWKFDETDPNDANAYDSSGSGYDGTIYNATFAAGHIDGAFNFDGAGDYVDVPSGVFDNVDTQISISLWVYGASSQPRNDMSFGSTGTGGTYYTHMPWSNEDVYWSAGTGNMLIKTAVSDNYKGRWNHWVFTADSDANEVQIYLNGDLWDSGTCPGSLPYVTTFAIGADAVTWWYAGRIDDFRIYDDILTASEIEELSLGVEDDLIGWWKFDETDGNDANAYDSSGYENAGTIYNAAFDDGHVDGGFDFDGSGDYVDIPSAAFGPISTQITVAFWQFGDVAAQPEYTMCFGSTGTGAFYSHLPWGDNIYWYAGTDQIYKTATLDEYAGRWNHWAFTFDTDTDEMQSYLNGDLWDSTSSATSTMPSITTFVIGAGSGGTNYFYNGRMDDFRIYDRVLTAGEIDELSLGVGGNLVGWWKFDDASGTTAADSSGLEHDGDVNGADWSTGYDGGALHFGLDSNDNVDIPSDVFSTISSEITISLWQYGDAVTGQEEMCFGSNNYYIYSHIPWYFDGHSYKNNVYWCAGTPSVGQSIKKLVDSNDMYKGQWNNWTFTKNSDTGVTRIYHDGLLWHSGNSSASPITDITEFRIGSGLTFPGYYYHGKIDDFKIYDVELDPPEVAHLFGLDYTNAWSYSPLDGAGYTTTDLTLSWSVGDLIDDTNGHDVYFGTSFADVNDATTASSAYMGRQTATTYAVTNYDANGLQAAATYYWRIDEVNTSDGNSPWKDVVLSFTIANNTDPNLVGWWPFDGESAEDASGNNYDGQISGNPTWGSGLIDGAIRFDADGYVNVDANVFDNISTEITITLWQFGDVDTQYTEAFGTLGSGSYYAHIPWGDLVQWQVNGDQISKAPDNWYDYSGRWNHWVFTKDTDVDTMNIYLNGQLWDSNSSMTSALPTITDFVIGAGFSGSTVAFKYGGAIDDFRIYNEILSADEIDRLYQTDDDLTVAWNPSPVYGAEFVQPDAILSWSPGDDAADANGHDVYLGTSWSDVNDAITSSSQYKAAQDTNSYTPTLTLGQIYYWRVDEVNAADTWKGNIWSFTVTPAIAYNPNPENTDSGRTTMIVPELSWAPGFSAADTDGHDVYFGTSSADVDAATTASSLYQGRQDANSFQIFTMLNDGFEETNWDDYWENDGHSWVRSSAQKNSGSYSASATNGSEGTFTSDNLDTSDANAVYVDFWFRKSGIEPTDFTLYYYDGSTYDPIVELDSLGSDNTWINYTATITDSQYLNSSFRIRFDATLSGGEDVWVDDVVITTQKRLNYGQNYYWRVDEVNGITSWKGDVWNFATMGYNAVDDFEAYTSTSNLKATWIDGSDAGNSSNSTITLNAIPCPYDYFEANELSMALAYDNTTGPNYSEVYRSYGTSQNWVESNIDAFSLWFKGDSSNAKETLYIFIEDSDSNAVVNYSDSNDLQEEWWHVWQVNLSSFTGIDANSITKIGVGFGDRTDPTAGSGSGTVYFNNAKLYPVNASQTPVTSHRVVYNCDGWDVFTSSDRTITGWLDNVFNPIENSQVDALFWCDGSGGNTARYDSDVLELWGERSGDTDEMMQWIAEGNDPAVLVTEEAVTRGIDSVYYSFRINDIHDSFLPAEYPSYKEDNPEWMRGPGQVYGYPTGLDLTYADVLDIKFDVIAEMADKYDFKGVEIDFMRGVPHFMPGTESDNAHILTQFLRRVRSYLNSRNVELAVRVDENLDTCWRDGFDVETWVNERLIDILILGSGAGDVSVEEFTQIAQGSGVLVYPCLEAYSSYRGAPNYRPRSKNISRALALNYWNQGADGIYTFNWYPHDKQVEYQASLFDEIGDTNDPVDPNATWEFPADHHQVIPVADYPYNWVNGVLPADMNSADISSIDVPFVMGKEDLDGGDTLTLFVNCSNLDGGDTMVIKLNGNTMTQSRNDQVISATPALGDVNIGRNEVSIVLSAGVVTIDYVELHVE